MAPLPAASCHAHSTALRFSHAPPAVVLILNEPVPVNCFCSVLLGAVRGAVTTPFQRLPAVVALFCAEASLAVMYPGAPMYPPINRYLLRKAVVDLQVEN